jgi:hypothetical protein
MTVSIDGMDFERTDIPNGVDDSGLLVAKTLLTNSQAQHAAQRLQELRESHRPITHGQMVMHKKSGDVDVVGWGNSENPAEYLRFPERLNGQDISWDEKGNSTLEAAFSGELFSSALLSVKPGFEHHPAAVNWLTSVAIAAAKTEADARFLVRLMREDEYDALLRCVYGDMSQTEINAMSVLEKPNTVSVTDPEAQQRTRKGITDAFGHMLNWLEDLSDLGELTANDVQMLNLLRILRGASYLSYPEDVGMADYGEGGPEDVYYDFGVRLVAVPRRQ